MKGIGIDTGGTCTDAVIYDFEKKAVLASAKTLTTHQDLKEGITRALRALPEELLRECGQAALSTTLATNACVENRGGHGKIIFFGVSRKVFWETFRNYGYRNPDDVMLVDCRILPDPAVSEEPDWNEFRERIPAFLEDCDCVSIVQLYAADHGGAYEFRAQEIIREFKDFRDIPVILGNTLFADRNAIRRGAGALLNARLVPVVYAFMEAIREVFSSLGLDVPITIIRSDGSQMTETFAAERPVETLLCGPAASVIGACTLSDTKNALVVDMGGTTTDIAIVKNRAVRRAKDGIQVGDWKTFVKGLYVDTFGLGGDTRIYYDRGGRVRLAKTRVQPLCTLAAAYPQVLEELRALDESGRLNVTPLYEFFILLRDIGESVCSGETATGESAVPDADASPSAGSAGDTGKNSFENTGASSPSSQHKHFYNSERALCRALKKGPLSYEKACAAMGKDIYTADFSRLEAERVILRCGLTPTDFMHLRGDFDAFCGEASRHAAAFFVRSSEAADIKDLTERAYDLVTERLYKNIVRILLTTECDSLAKKPFDSQMDELIDYAWQIARSGSRRHSGFLPWIFQTRAKLVGVGAPTHVYLPRVAKMLHTRAVLPEYAAVANAVGAITGQVTAITEVLVNPVTGDDYGKVLVITPDARRTFSSRAAALSWARKEGRRIARERAAAQGACGEVEVREEH
ncbi:MAG: hydantoinase/oxoprolinase family protein, partial [Eubacteriales bacterium]|nr:hydantoinase/oxoprolinase family protein [Eubacteriales bacterium]